MTKALTFNRENNPAAAFWCDEHGRLECVHARALNRGGGRCHSMAIKGLNACRRHSGFSSTVAKARGDAKVSAWMAMGEMNGAVDPGQAVLAVLQMSWLRLAAYSELLRQQVEAKQQAIEDQYNEAEGAGGAGGLPADGSAAAGLIGQRYGMGGKDGVLYVVSEEVRALVILEAAERDRVVKYAKVAHDMGISDRLTSLAEQWGDMVAGRVTAMLDALQLTPEQQAMVPLLVQSHLGSLELTQANVQ